MFAVFAVFLLCLMSVSRSAPMVCEELVHPSQLDPHQLEGRWALVAGSLNHQPSMESLRLRDSITMYFSNSTSGNSNFSYTQINRFGDQCQYLRYNMSADGSDFTFDVGDRFDFEGSFHYTSCPDCVVMRWIVKSTRRRSLDLYLLSRRREVDQKELEEFMAQLKCYGLPTPVMMDPTKELCPEQPESQTTAAAPTEEKSEEPKA